MSLVQYVIGGIVASGIFVCCPLNLCPCEGNKIRFFVTRISFVSLAVRRIVDRIKETGDGREFKDSENAAVSTSSVRPPSQSTLVAPLMDDVLSRSTCWSSS